MKTRRQPKSGRQYLAVSVPISRRLDKRLENKPPHPDRGTAECYTLASPSGGPAKRPTRGEIMTIGRSYQGEISERVKVWIDKNVPLLRQKMFQKVFFGKVSPRTAIKAKCYECAGFEKINETVYDCRSYTCPLWRFRPQPAKKTTKVKLF